MGLLVRWWSTACWCSGGFISFSTIIGMIRLNVPVWFNFNSGCKAVSSSGGMGARQGGGWVETKVLTFDLRKSKKCILGMKFYSCVRRHIWGRLERKLEEIVAMESQEMHWREWKVSNFKPEEAARELEDLFPDSKLWQRPPFESELEAVWVWIE